MMRAVLIGPCLAVLACVDNSSPVRSASALSQVVSGATGELRLRCGSETLRARLRQGQVVVDVDGGKNRVLVPVRDTRARSGRAYSDGKLTLYQVPDTQSWTLANAEVGTVKCKPGR